MSFSDIFAAMVVYLQNLGSKLTDFTPTSIIGQILQAVASVIDEIYFSITDAKNQAYISTATGSGLDSKGADYDLPRKAATSSQWYFSFIKNQVSTQDQDIPLGTVITTIPQENQEPITFTTNADSYLPAGSLNVLVLATCETPGTIGNIAPNTPLLIGSATPGIDGVELTSLTNGIYGLDQESDTDYQTRLLNGLKSKAQGTIDWYQETAEGVTGVQSAFVNPQGRGSGTVDVYIVGTGNALPSTALISQVQDVIDAGRIITDDAKVFAPNPIPVNETLSVTVATGYDPTSTGINVQTAITNYINGLGIGGGTGNKLYQSRLISVALGVDGVIDASQTGQSDITFNVTDLPQAGTITINASH